MKKKVFIILLAGLLLIFIGLQFNLFRKYDGNLIVNISNQSKIDSVNIDLYIDGEKQITGLFENEPFHNYKEYIFKTQLGRHTVLIKNENNNLSKEIKINTILVTWLIVDFYENDDITKDKNFTFYTEKQRKPLIIE
jgi:hypothetical protein